ncbi:hypothetical protein COO60DRAFT_1534606 [Scenedesmus sp. NREL 46B-D3]|nr:hypothetical protein COO60DRAFT_1534606 [Scenedesmus sp. NREL 46B-D3]
MQHSAGGGSSSSSRAMPAGPSGDGGRGGSWVGHAHAAAGYYFDAAGSSNSLPDFGGVTPSSASGFSPTSTATSLAATPMYYQPWLDQQHQSQQHGGQQQQQHHSMPNPPTAAAAAAARLGRRGSRGHSHVSGTPGYSALSSLDGGFSRDERQHSADGAGWGRLSGVNTPAGYHSSRCCSEAQTPRGADAGRAAALREGSAAAAGGEAGAAAVSGTSYLRYRGEYILPATHLPYAPHGPAVWRVTGTDGLAMAVGTLLREPLERRSRGHAAAQAAAKLASGLVSTVWHVVDDVVVTPALQDYVAANGAPGSNTDAAVQAARAPTRVLGHSVARN